MTDADSQCSNCGHVWPVADGSDCPRVSYCHVARHAAARRALAAGAAMIPEIDADSGTDEMRDRIQAICRELSMGRTKFTLAERRQRLSFDTAVSSWGDRHRARLQREKEAADLADADHLVEVRRRYSADGVLTMDDVRFLIWQAFDDYEMGPTAIADSIEELLKDGAP